MEKQDLTKGYQDVDHSQTDYLIKFLEDFSRFPAIVESFETQLKWLNIQPGDQVLDIGCGIGDHAMQMAKLVGKNGKVIGTDLSAAMIEASKKRHGNLSLPLEFIVADALRQPFADQTFDCIRLERVLQYIKNTDAAFKEFKRLLKPGGKLIIFDTNWDTLVIPHADKKLTRKIMHFISDSFPSGMIGSELLGYFKDYDFKDVQVKGVAMHTSDLNLTKRVYEGIINTSVASNVFTKKEIDDWWAVLENYNEKGKYFLAYLSFIAMGIK